MNYLQPSLRLWVWSLLVTLLGLLVNAIIPALLGVALLGGDALLSSSSSSGRAGAASCAIHGGEESASGFCDWPCCGFRRQLPPRLLLVRCSAAALVGVASFQAALWVLLKALPLRTTVSPMLCCHASSWQLCMIG